MLLAFDRGTYIFAHSVIQFVHFRRQSHHLLKTLPTVLYQQFDGNSSIEVKRKTFLYTEYRGLLTPPYMEVCVEVVYNCSAVGV